jgi:hypothetical protein
MPLDEKPLGEVVYFVIKQRHIMFGKPENLFSFGVAKQVKNLERYVAGYNADSSAQKQKSGHKLTLP